MRTVGKASARLLAWAVLFCCVGSVAIAQEPSGNLAETWVIHTKAGQEAEFEQAFQTHLEVRKGKGDPRAWHTWVPVTGADIGAYVVRSCCSAWKDMDGYRDWSLQAEIVVDWNQNVHQYVERYEHYFGEVDFENSHWSGDGVPNYVGLTALYPKMGTAQTVAQHVTAFSTAAREMEWPYEWAWIQTIGGDGELVLVTPYADFAAMEPPEKTFVQALSEKMGAVATGQMFAAWADNFEKTRYTIYRFRADMSLMPDE